MLAYRNPALLILMCFVLAACSGAQVRTQQVRFKVAPDLNENTPLALDIVAVYDKQLVAALQKLSAKQWMQQKQQFKRDHPLLLRMWEWELVPGQAVPDFAIPGEILTHPAGIMLFANYRTPGLHRARLDAFQQVLISLDKDDMRLYTHL